VSLRNSFDAISRRGALQVASGIGRRDIVELLLEHGAIVHARGEHMPYVQVHGNIIQSCSRMQTWVRDSSRGVWCKPRHSSAASRDWGKRERSG
jgi:hypothetical protein